MILMKLFNTRSHVVKERHNDTEVSSVTIKIEIHEGPPRQRISSSGNSRVPPVAMEDLWPLLCSL